MPALADVVGADLSNYEPVSALPVSHSNPGAPSNSLEPGYNSFQRCPIPPTSQSNPDSLRQFYQSNIVPQNRIYNAASNTPPLQTVQQVTNVTQQITNSTTIPVSATQNAGLISNDGTSGSRQFYQTTNPDTTPPVAGYIYQNTNSSPILVTASADGGGGGFHGSVYCDASSTPTTLVARFCRVNDGSSNPDYYPGSVTFVVPTGYYYGISVTSGGAPPSGTNALDSWTEWIIGK